MADKVADLIDELVKAIGVFLVSVVLIIGGIHHSMTVKAPAL